MKWNAAALVIAPMLVAAAHSASADVLWDQSDFDAFGPGFFNSVSGEPPFGLTVHAVNDVVIGDGGWNLTSITTFYSALDPFWADGIFEGHLHIFEKTGPLPDDLLDDPTLSPLVTTSASFNGDHIAVTATGLDVDIMPGEYWIGLTPVAPSGPFGPEIHLSSMTLIGDSTASYDVFAPGWFNFNPGVDASILIEGTVIPGPAGLLVLAMGGLAARRRRR